MELRVAGVCPQASYTRVGLKDLDQHTPSYTGTQVPIYISRSLARSLSVIQSRQRNVLQSGMPSIGQQTGKKEWE
jgi:hypothetical protein